jgi:tetratricopeptide (TPR) repeat protein
MNGWSDDRSASLKTAQQIAQRAIAIDPRVPLSYFVTGLVFREQKEYVKALVEAEKAISYEPNYANAHVLLATLLYYAGRPEESVERLRKAMRLNPHHPFNYTFHLGQAYYTLRRYEVAVATFQKGIASNPESERLHVWLAASLAQAGRLEDAAWEVDQILVLNPEFNLLD